MGYGTEEIETFCPTLFYLNNIFLVLVLLLYNVSLFFLLIALLWLFCVNVLGSALNRQGQTSERMQITLKNFSVPIRTRRDKRWHCMCNVISLNLSFVRLHSRWYCECIHYIIRSLIYWIIHQLKLIIISFISRISIQFKLYKILLL